MLNNAMYIGRLAQDPEVRYTKSGTPVTTFSVAVNRSLPKDGVPSAADFIPVVVWGSLAEACGNNLAKGHQVFVSGPMRPRSYETTDGQKRRTTELVANFVAQSLLHEKKHNSQSSQQSPVDFGVFGRDVIDQEIPF